MSVKQLPIPSHYDPKTVADVRRVEYYSIFLAAREWVKQFGVKPAATDKYRIAVMPIDMQISFCIPGYELFVGGRSGNGAVEDSARFCEFVYRNLQFLSAIFPTMDTHFLIQIFFTIFWINDKGEHPAPNVTMITYDDVVQGTWKPNPAVANAIAGGNYPALVRYAEHYTKKLTDGGKYALMIWDFHTMLTGIGHALVPAVDEAIFFHNSARTVQTGTEIKGGNPLTENYSVLRPEVLDSYDGRPVAQKNAAFFKKLMEFDAIVIPGQAKSHCVAWTIDDLLNEILAQDPKLARKVYLLEDCTSAVVIRDPSGNIIPGLDFTPMADDAFNRFADAGMNVVKSTDPIESWPGVRL